MKNLIILIAIFSYISCGKDDENPKTSITNSSFISMKINGVAWKGNVNFVSGLFQNNFSCQGTMQVGEKSQIASFGFENVSLTEKNVLDKNSSGAFLFLDNVNSKSWGFGNGSSGVGEFKITKTKVSGTITQASGTFSGTTEDSDNNTIVVTEGMIFNALAE